MQQQYSVLAAAKGFESFTKLFELAGNEPAQAKVLAEKEAYHLAQLMADNADLASMPPTALMMEMRKIPLQGVSLDPSLKLAYLLVQDKRAGKVELIISGRGKAVQAIAQNIIKNIDVDIIFEGDNTSLDAGLVKIVPTFKASAKVNGAIVTITWSDGRISQKFFRESHINSWKKRSADRFAIRYENNQKLATPIPNPNKNYLSFNGGIEPGFMATKALKHTLDRVGINPFPNAYKKLRQEQIDALPDDAGEQVYTEDTDAEVVDDVSRQEFVPDVQAPEQNNDEIIL